MNFDEEINRYDTNCVKYDFKKYKNIPEDVFPMWVADMDFRCCDEILMEMHQKLNHGILGYSKEDQSYFNAIKNWYKKKYDVTLNQEWLIPTPGIVFALATIVKVITEENDYVLINYPVYHSFTDVVLDNKRQIISSDLVLTNGHYEFDFNDFETKIKEYNVKLFLLCSPHNPVGRVWTKEELDKIIAICKKNHVFIVSDEIHSDFVWSGKHTCLLKYQDYQDNIILCTSPSKSFNLSGLQISNIFIPSVEIRQKFQIELWNTGYSLINIMGLVACKAAYQKGDKWLNELKKYIIGNIEYVDKFLKEKLPKIQLIYPEGTYLLWLDFNKLGLSDDKIDELLINDAKLWLNSGKMFGPNGCGFQRINIALPRKNLKKALENLEKAFKNY